MKLPKIPQMGELAPGPQAPTAGLGQSLPMQGPAAGPEMLNPKRSKADDPDVDDLLSLGDDGDEEFEWAIYGPTDED